MSEATEHRKDWSRWAAIALTGLIALAALTVQWGIVTAKLDHLEKRLDELIAGTHKLRSAYRTVERRISYLEGLRGASTTLPDREPQRKGGER